MEYIKPEEIGAQMMSMISSVGLDCILEFFQSEEHQREFEQWKMKRGDIELLEMNNRD